MALTKIPLSETAKALSVGVQERNGFASKPFDTRSPEKPIGNGSFLFANSVPHFSAVA